MNVIVTPNFRADDPMQREYVGDVIRLERLEDGIWGVAIRILTVYNPGDCTDTKLPKIPLFPTS